MRRTSRSRGFTLFEVLAAVLVLGLFYSVLAAKASQGMRAEGENLRRLEASLVADEALARVETLIASGVAPPVETTEEQVGNFSVEVEVAPLDVLPLLPDDAFPEDYEGDSLFALADTGEEGLLRTIDVRVSWEEAGLPREVRRTTYAYDPTVLAAFFPSDDFEGGAGEDGEGAQPPVDSPFLNDDGSPDFDAMMKHLEGLDR